MIKFNLIILINIRIQKLHYIQHGTLDTIVIVYCFTVFFFLKN